MKCANSGIFFFVAPARATEFDSPMNPESADWIKEERQLCNIARALDGKDLLPENEQPKRDRTGPAILIGLAAAIAFFGIYLFSHNRPEPTPTPRSAPAFTLAELATKKPTNTIQPTQPAPPRITTALQTRPQATGATTLPVFTPTIKVDEQKTDLWMQNAQTTKPAKTTLEGTSLTRTLAEIHEEIWPTVQKP